MVQGDLIWDRRPEGADSSPGPQMVKQMTFTIQSCSSYSPSAVAHSAENSYVQEVPQITHSLVEQIPLCPHRPPQLTLICGHKKTFPLHPLALIFILFPSTSCIRTLPECFTIYCL